MISFTFGAGIFSLRSYEYKPLTSCSISDLVQNENLSYSMNRTSRPAWYGGKREGHLQLGVYKAAGMAAFDNRHNQLFKAA